jgi:16S rRNA (adenine1518-N6/adenine1519-N6)-dimethyltransferase
VREKTMDQKRTRTTKGYKAKKALGQHFLTREKVLWQIVQLAGLSDQDTVVEIGAGPGNLTRKLARRARLVHAIEFDRDLAGILAKKLQDENIMIIPENALFFDYRTLAAPGEKLKVVANLPYNISTQLIFKLMETPELFSFLLLMVQREVGLRLVAKPGTKDYGILAVFIQMRADTEIVLEVGPEAFRPRPKVHSTLVRLSLLDEPREKLADEDFFRKVVRAAFSKRRKTLRNSIARSGLGYEPQDISDHLWACGIDPARRAETLSLAEFARLANYLFQKEGGKG